MKLVDLAKKVVQELNERDNDHYYLKEIIKPNDIRHIGIAQNDETVSPVIYLDSIPNVRTLSPSAIAEKVKELMAGSALSVSASSIDSITFKRENIFFQLLNKNKNTNYLTDVPVVPFLDLVFVPRYLVNMNDHNVSSMPLNNKLLESLDVDVKRDFRELRKNTLRLFGVKVTNMLQMLARLTASSEDFLGMKDCKGTIAYVISNNIGVNGAATALLSGAYRALAPNGILLPSSIHEFLALPLLTKYDLGVGELKNMVKDVNTTCVDPGEVLSDNAYYWSEGKELEIVCIEETWGSEGVLSRLE